MEITFCCDLPEDEDHAREFLSYFRRAGATSIQSYIHWQRIEPQPGRFEWDYYDRQVALIQEYGLRWVPFIILGPWYVTPEWFQTSPESLFARCLEHDRESRVQSIWNPALPSHIERVMAAFSRHYLNMDVLESILLGISGDYGEAIYQAVGNWPKAYHTHQGYWCGDVRAVADFQRWLREQFGSLADINRRWGSQYQAWEEVRPVLRQNAPSARAWLDQMRWYRQAMTDWADLWFQAAGRHFPDVPIYLCTGGDGTSHHGSDFSLQCKLAARHGGGVRITNEGSDYLFNFIITRLVSSASRYYGAFFGFEPASAVDENGIVARIYNAAASGARQLHDYAHNFFAAEGLREAVARRFEANADYLREKRPRVRVAVLLPLSDFTCQEVGFSVRMVDSARWLRDITDFDFVDENMICDGALERYRYLIVLDGKMLERETLEAIEAWIRQGGAIVSWQLLSDVEGSDEVSRRIFGLSPQSEELTGIQPLRLLEPAFLQHLGKVPQLVTVQSYSHLAETAHKAAITGADETAVVWLNRLGQGWGIFYAGPSELDLNLSFAWMGEQHMYLHLIRDCLFHLSAIDSDWVDLPILDNELDGVYVTDMEDGWLYLNFNPYEVQKRTLDGTVVDLPPYAIQETRFSGET